jgi:hypothetical protein
MFLSVDWHDWSGHLNLHSVQRILQSPLFTTMQFLSASRCSMQTLKCSICQCAINYRKATPSPTLSTLIVPDLNNITGSLKRNDLCPGAHVSVGHFESRILFDVPLIPLEKHHQTCSKGAASLLNMPMVLFMLNTKIGFQRWKQFV